MSTLKEQKPKREITVTDTILQISKEVFKLRVLKGHLEKNIRLLKNYVNLPVTNIVTPLEESLKEVNYQMSLLKERTNQYVRTYFHPLGYDMSDTFVISSKDLMTGYMFLQKVVKRDEKGKVIEEELYVLFLHSYDKKGFDIKKGDIVSYEKVKDLIEPENGKCPLHSVIRYPSWFRKHSYIEKLIEYGN